MRRFAILILALLLVASIGSISLGEGGDNGIIDAVAPPEETVSSQTMQEILAQVGGLLGGDALGETSSARQTVTVSFQNMAGNPITSIAKGNTVRVVASHDSVTPMRAVCILVLPTTEPYKEIMIEVRQYTGGSGGEHYYFYIPSWSQIGGTAVALVSVTDAGVGWATLDVY